MSTAWTTIAVEDLNDYLVAAQMTALRESALADGQADPFTNIMHARCNYVRNRIAGRVDLSATAYAVPPELKTQTCLLIIEAMQGRIPSLSLTEDQRRQIARAYDDLKIAGTTDFPISTATDAATPETEGGAVTPSYSDEDPPGGPRNFDRDDQDGI
jgi:hypothetical protein